MNEWTNEWTNERINLRTNEWTNERTNEQTNEQMNEWMNEWMNEQTVLLMNEKFKQCLMSWCKSKRNNVELLDKLAFLLMSVVFHVHLTIRNNVVFQAKRCKCPWNNISTKLTFSKISWTLSVTKQLGTFPLATICNILEQYYKIWPEMKKFTFHFFFVIKLWMVITIF